MRARDAPQRCYRGPCGPSAAPGGTSRGALPAAPGTSVAPPLPPLQRGAAGRMRANGVRWRSRGRFPSARTRLRPGAPRPRPGEARPVKAARPEAPRGRMRGAPARPSARPAHRPPAGGCSLASLTWAWSQRRSAGLGSAPRSLSGSRSLSAPPRPGISDNQPIEEQDRFLFQRLCEADFSGRGSGGDWRRQAKDKLAAMAEIPVKARERSRCIFLLSDTRG